MDCRSFCWRQTRTFLIMVTMFTLLFGLGQFGCSGSSQCTENSECSANQVCTNGACTNTGGCTADKDCSEGQVCEGNQCKAKPVEGCKADAECKDGESCKNGKCVEKAKDGCTESSCKTGEICVDTKRCIKVPTACQKNGDCSEGEICGEAKPGTNACFVKCDPTNNAADGTNQECWSGFGLCQLLYPANPNLGVCIPPRKKDRKEGETCNDLSDFTEPDFNGCASDLNCTNGKCIPNCKESEGKATNPVCDPGFYCEESDGKGMCKPLPKKQDGGRTLGQQCSNTRAAFFCDGDKGLYCNGGRCATACDPRKGADNNSKCEQGQACLEDPTESYLGGGCSIKPTQKAGEDCSSTKLCLEGLTCSQGKCLKACSASNDTCEKDQKCHTQFRICVKGCDPAKGGSANPDCEVGYRCTQSQTVRPGYCRGLPSFTEGKQQLGDSCSTTQDNLCDGSKKLYCSQGTCRQACDLRKGTDTNADCGAGFECSESQISPLGGVCLATASAKEGEACNSTSNRCVTGLSCYRSRCSRSCKASATGTQGDCKSGEWCLRTTQTGGICATKCDPANGTATNTSCAGATYCRTSNSYKPGYCSGLPSPPSGKGQQGDACSQTNTCDGTKDLTCFQSKCIQACNPKDGEKTNAKCASGESCVVNTSSSHLGGVCLGPPSQKENEECDGIKRCVLGNSCIQLGGKSYCQKTCDPSQTGQCPTGTTCQRQSSGGGYCMTARKKDRKLNEECRGAPATDAYNDCGDKLTCATTSAGKSFCLSTCTTSGGSSSCPKDYTCTRSGTSRVCTQNCTKDEDCKAYGGTCRSFGQTRFCL